MNVSAGAASAQCNIVSELTGLFSRYLALNEGVPLALSLWSLATHLHDRFDAFPYLAITSPTKRCGKTRVCEVLSLVCHKPQQTVGISPAALYRLIQSEAPTLLIDEAEYLGRNRDDRASVLREILNTGYRKGQAVLRCKKKKSGDNEEDYTPESFKTYSPKVFVLIGNLQDTLADRCIEIRMIRRADANLERFRLARIQADTFPLRQSLKLWVSEHGAAVEDYYQKNDVPILQDREAELWLPLFSVCAVAAPARLEELAKIARQLSRNKSEGVSEDTGVKLLSDVRQIFAEAGPENDRQSTAELLGKLNSLEESPWGGWNHGKGLNPYSLARSLQPFGVYSQNIRSGEHVVKGYLRQSFEDSWSRYL